MQISPIRVPRWTFVVCLLADHIHFQRYGPELEAIFAEQDTGEKAMTTFNAVGTSFIAAIVVLGFIVAIL